MPTLIVFSHLRWGFVHQRPQHLMSRLGPRWRVLFVEEPVRGRGPARLERITEAPGCDVLCPRTSGEPRGFDDPALAPLLAAFLRDERIEPAVAWLTTPAAWPLAQALRPRALVYDAPDDGADGSAERALLEAADAVLAATPAACEARRRLRGDLLCLPSGVDAPHFAPSRARPDDAEAQAAERLHATLPRPRLGFAGVIDERIDLPLLAALADARPRWQFILAGPVLKIDPASLPQRANLHWLGLQPYARLPRLMRHWDLCLLPFAAGAATRGGAAAKALEGFAAQKPVVATALHEVAALCGDAAAVGDGAAGMLAACEAVLGEGPRQRAVRLDAMRAALAATSWERGAERVRELLEDLAQNASPRAPARAAPQDAQPASAALIEAAAPRAALPLAATN